MESRRILIHLLLGLTKKKHLKEYFFIYFILLSAICSSQNRYLHFEFAEDIPEFRADYSKSVQDSAQAFSEAREILSQLHNEAYLTASIDSFIFTKDSATFFIVPGDRYSWARLEKGNVEEGVLSNIGFRDHLYFEAYFKPRQFAELIEKLLSFYENRGYPFAQIELDSIRINDSEIEASLKLQKNKLLKIDSILIEGESGISKKFLYNFIAIEPGDVYNQSLIAQISDRIAEIPFIQEEKDFEVRYFDEKTKLILYLKKQAASRFDGILGVLTDEEDGKISINGDVNLNLINALNRGENIRLNWRSLQEQTQDLNMNFIYPYLFNTPLGFDFDFKLYKKDTTYIDLFTTIGLRYILKRNDYFKIFIQRKNSNLLSKQSLVNQYTSTLPPYADTRTRLYGIEYQLERLNYRYNPSKGFALLSNFAVGNKKIQKLQELEKENPEIYKGLNLNSHQYNGYLEARFFIPFFKRSSILIANQSAVAYSESLFQNELLRIGGLKSLRGFDEESINASLYSIFTLEYRFLLDRNSYFSLFTDAAYYENDSRATYIKDTPIGFGAGISFETAAGIFTLNYALGKQFDNPVYFRAAKIHFGFINFF